MKGKKTNVDEKQSLMTSRSWLTLALPEKLARNHVNTLTNRQRRHLRGPTSCLWVQETDVDMGVILKFFEFMRRIISEKGQS